MRDLKQVLPILKTWQNSYYKVCISYGSQRPSESSNNSMDENISDSELEINLNSKALTNQTCAVPMPQ